MNLTDIASSKRLTPVKMLLYGPPKVGKSTFAAGAPAVVFLPCEAGLDSLDVPAFPLAPSWTDVLGAIEVLATAAHDYHTAVLDSLDWLEPLAWGAVCAKSNVSSIELVGGGFGKGYGEAAKLWKELLDGLDWLRSRRGMAVVLICHDEIRKLEPPDGDSFDFAGLKLHKRAAALVTEWADVIGYARVKRAIRSEDLGFNKKHKRAVSLGDRVLTVGQDAAYLSGNRYGLVDEVPLDWAAFDAALTAARSK